MRRHPVLTAVEGPALGMCWELTGSHLLGRDGDVAVDDATLSREHLHLRCRGRSVRCADAGSANGSYLRPVRCVRRRLGTGWTRLRRGAVLELGSGSYRLMEGPGPLRERHWGGDGVLRLLVPLAMAMAMVPFALGGPPWRWAMVAAPLAAVALLARGRESEIVRSSRPAHVLLASRDGRAFHSEPVVPRELRALRRPLAGTGWCILGTRCEQQAIWLAGYLAVHNDPDVLRVVSPWITTLGSGVEVRFAADGCGPATGQSMVTWRTHHAPQWAVVLHPPVWAAAGQAWGDALARDGGASRRSRTVSARLLGAGEVRRSWARGRADLAVPLGEGADGPLVIDLVRDGPHALVAGMSGAGKSELLTTWLLELAQRNPPSHLHFILVDFKGGAAFNHLRPLPHCVGVLTDLDEGGTRRALASLRAQLRARKESIAALGCRELAEYNGRADAPIPLLVVVIDEFRALSLDHPDLLEQFLHLANQGRSLGIHLIAATQRPGGAVSPELRANMPLRICLRVAEVSDSLDVISVPDAARLPPVPGQALVLRDVLTRVQIGWSGDSITVDRTAHAIARLWEGPPTTPPWCPPLPTLLPAATLGSGDLALADEPDHLRQRPVALPAEGLLILGNPRSGRSLAAHTAAAAALSQGDEVWLVTSGPHPGPAAGAFGGVVEPRGTRQVGHLLHHLAAAGERRRTLVFDDVELWMDAHDALHGAGTAVGTLATFVRAARSASTRLVITAPPGATHARWAAPLTTHLHLSGLDPATALASGLPRSAFPEVCGTAVPGRGLLLPGNVLVQVAVTEGRLPPGPGTPARFAPLPLVAEVPAVPGRIVLGLGASGTVSVGRVGDVVVLGPPGSGRSTTARLVHDQYPCSTVQEDEVGDLTGPIIATTTPATFATSYTGAMGRLRNAATVIMLRPDLYPRVPGPDYSAEVEPGSPGYAVVLHHGRATAVRLARRVRPSVLEESQTAVRGEERARTGGREAQDDEGGERRHGRREPGQERGQREHREDDEEVGREEDRTWPDAPAEQ